MTETEKLIEKWNDKHSSLLSDYSSYKNLSENEALFLRSEMKNVLDFIEDLKNLPNEPKTVSNNEQAEIACPNCKNIMKIIHAYECSCGMVKGT